MSARPASLPSRNPRRKTELRVVRRRSRRLVTRSVASRVAPAAIAAAIGVVAIVSAVLLEQVVLAQSAFHLSDLSTELQAAETRHEELLLESATLDSAARIERYARDTLGMVDPPPGSVRYIVAKVRAGGRLRLVPPNGGAVSGPGVAAGGSTYFGDESSP